MSALDRMPGWLRWASVLPFSVVAYLVVDLLNALAPVPSWANWIVACFNSYASAVAFVVAGSMMAPRVRFGVSLALAVVECAILIGVACWATARGPSTTGPWEMWGHTAIGIVGAACGPLLSKSLDESR
jgi:hypothetical protein